MNSWDKMHPVNDWECKRSKRIEIIQGDENKFAKDNCIILEKYKI